MDEIKKLRSKLHKIGVLFVIIGLAYLIFSISTKSWQPTEATLISSSNNTYVQSDGGPSFRSRIGSGGSFSWPSVKYEYHFQDHKFQSSIMCVCVPIGLEAPLQKTVTAYVSPYYPALAVLVQGPHFLFSLLSFFIGGVCFFFSSVLGRYGKA
ncbi:DUF3592 domain-containing protein [Marinobacter sp. ANT_B65]|uniref:DUF3592 domain-containing protein n=1 Tax=Marinobacter sp. ANT_B65 TaxID=2039467 RepID=UPI0015CA3B5B|nr:DUF3592 domain-containing protein [Marinobacter sp. ANT_B65]